MQTKLQSLNFNETNPDKLLTKIEIQHHPANIATSQTDNVDEVFFLI